MGRDKTMPGKVVCEVCGNNQDRCFEVHMGGERHVFDSFECAILGLMPKCSLCGSLIWGSGIQIDNIRVCSTVCAHQYSTQEFSIGRDIKKWNKY